MDYHLLPAEVKSWILPTLVSVSVVPSDWDFLYLRGPAWRRKQSRLPKRSVLLFLMCLLHDGWSPKEEDCICMLHTIVKKSVEIAYN